MTFDAREVLARLGTAEHELAAVRKALERITEAPAAPVNPVNPVHSESNEACLSGSSGDLWFDVTTGWVTRRSHTEEYSKWVRVDVYNYVNIYGRRFKPGDNEDILFVGLWSADGEFEPPVNTFEPLAHDPDRWIDLFKRNMKDRFGYDHQGFHVEHTLKLIKHRIHPFQHANHVADRLSLKEIPDVKS